MVRRRTVRPRHRASLRRIAEPDTDGVSIRYCTNEIEFRSERGNGGYFLASSRDPV
jgi:hypothetical protein